MKLSKRILLSGLLVLATIPISFEALGQTAPAPTLSDWFLHGYVEAGGRTFLNNPSRNTLAKFWEYHKIDSGIFLETLHLNAGTNNGLYNVEFWAKNVGEDYQSYELDASKAGEHYLTLGWSALPHLYSTSAQSIFGGTPTALTVDPGVVAALNAATRTGGATGNPGCYLSSQVGTAICGGKTPAQTTINNNVRTIDLGIKRDTAAAEYRWTPTPDVDVIVDYSNTKRTGNQEMGFLFGSAGTSAPMAQVPKPISDTTQGVNTRAEMVGFSPWGQKYNVSVGYSGSFYQNDFGSFTAQNPFGTPCAIATATSPTDCFGIGRMSLTPDNQSNAVTASAGVDLPWKSRYMGTFSYNMMRQNDPFMPMTINPGPIPAAGLTTVPIPGVPRGSLDGEINTLLANNVLTTQITPDLKSKFHYRYYSVDNNTPPLTLTSWIVNDSRVADGVVAGAGTVGCAGTAPNITCSYAPHTTMFQSYVKQNADGEVVWRPARWFNSGINFSWEQYQRDLAQVNVTNEYSSKVFADVTPMDMMKIRGSYLFATRQYDNYNWQAYVGNSILLGANGTSLTENPFMRTFDMANRDRNKALIQVDFMPTPELTFTPSAGFRNDSYGTDPTTGQVGMTHDNSWNAGLEATYALSRSINLMGSYTREQYDRGLIGEASVTPLASRYQSTIKDTVDTFLASMNIEVIPSKLDLKLNYSYSRSIDRWTTAPYGAGSTTTSNPAYPPVTDEFQRFEALAKYKLDPVTVHQLGWVGEVAVKLRYIWENNNMTNWQSDSVLPYMEAVTVGARQQVYLAGNNPNYNVHVLMASVGVKW